MRLLIKREQTLMEETKGRADVPEDVPEFLHKPHIVLPRYQQRVQKRPFADDGILLNEKDVTTYDLFKLPFFDKFGLQAMWSGHRSVLVSREEGQIYRLKGVAFNPVRPIVRNNKDRSFDVYGAQERFSAEYEQAMSTRFNRILSNEGIQPVMDFKGYWHFPLRVKKERYSGSIAKVEGDTRLDELMLAIEKFASRRAADIEENTHKLTRQGLDLFSEIPFFYFELGYVAGRLKALMDRNDQTWSSESRQSNAHAGNVVVYRKDEKLHLGLVDFDASCDTSDFPLSKIRQIQRKEYDQFIRSIHAKAASPRTMDTLCFRRGNRKLVGGFREYMCSGFAKGYTDKTLFQLMKNTVPLERFRTIVDILRSDDVLAIPRKAQKKSVSAAPPKKGKRELFAEQSHTDLMYRHILVDRLRNYR